MENSQQLNCDKLFFLKKFKKNPFFFCQHLYSVSAIVLHRYRLTWLSNRSENHVGHKQKPKWLGKILKRIDDDKNIITNLTNLPDRKINLHIHLPFQNLPELENPQVDQEDYLLKHRWANLTDDLFKVHSDHLDVLALPDNIKNFILYTPTKNDLAWETYSACERIANLLTWLCFVKNETRNKLAAQVKPFIYDSMIWIGQHLEYYKRETNNHILNNARALIMAGIFVNHNSSIKIGMQIFKEMLPLLIQSNGSLRERSSHYQLIVLNWLLDAHAFLKLKREVYLTEILFLEQTIQKMLQISALLCDPSGNLNIFIGDISPDLSPRKTVLRLLMCYPEFWPHSSADIKQATDDWYLLKAGKNKIILNCPSKIFPKHYPTHEHSDISSFVWLYDDKPIFIDPGRSRYTKDIISLTQKRSNAHNVVLVNGLPPLCESLIENGHWYPKPYAKANININSDNQSIIITHNGLKRATPVEVHTREILLTEVSLSVNDIFTGSGKINVEIFWQLHPAFLLCKENPLIFRHDSVEVYLKNFSADKQNIISSPKSMTKFYSSAYGQFIPYLCYVFTVEVSLPIKINTTFGIRSCVE